jgi:hypothetical protein
MEQLTLPGIETGEVDSESTHALALQQVAHLVNTGENLRLWAGCSGCLSLSTSAPDRKSRRH